MGVGSSGAVVSCLGDDKGRTPPLKMKRHIERSRTILHIYMHVLRRYKSFTKVLSNQTAQT